MPNTEIKLEFVGDKEINLVAFALAKAANEMEAGFGRVDYKPACGAYLRLTADVFEATAKAHRVAGYLEDESIALSKAKEMRERAALYP